MAFDTSDGVAPPNDDLDGAGSCEFGPGLASPQDGTDGNRATRPRRRRLRETTEPRGPTPGTTPSGVPPSGHPTGRRPHDPGGVKTGPSVISRPRMRRRMQVQDQINDQRSPPGLMRSPQPRPR